MSIQPDLQFKMKDGCIELIGFSKCTTEYLVFDQIRTNKKDRLLATHVLQLVFLGFTGFGFPFAHFPSTTATWYELYLLLLKSVNLYYVSTDGAQSNRDLLNLLLPKFDSANPVTCAFNNLYRRDNAKIFFVMDYSYDTKYSKRHLKVADKFIEWVHFTKAYVWDISSNPFPIHHKLTQEHICLTSEGKMRSHLAGLFFKI
ncbi:hypothetical protein KUTeg_018670 [Tegillarca granosa]|uniref:Uncharacterized protein n=1 Tax=Tegillarca granosa TaxID=220873 RepID=A0ABQ9EJJ0_TEGGR|nr:hypothetical protein KUTeg_018670 [Tegillarca granosa]